MSRRLDDHRIDELEAALRASGTAVLSLDCFDTLLWRRVPKPTDAFLLLGEELRDQGVLAGGVAPAGFAGMRVTAEALARSRKTDKGLAPEVNLAEIYAEFRPGLVDLTIDELRRAEVALERRITLADHLLAQALSRLAEELELRVVVVSDMYLGGEEIRHLLDRPAMGSLAGAEVISSADEGIGKQSGLWRILPERWGVEPEAIVHVGNNWHADVAAPRAVGVRAVHWAETPGRLTAILAAEDCRPAPGAKLSLLSVDDAGLTALRGRAAFSSSAREHEDQVAWETGSSILGPVMSGYADWVHRRTAELGITHALCIMREGRLLKELLESVAPSSRNPSLRCELLWASRAAIARANIVHCTREELAAMFSRACAPSVAEAARTLGVEPSAVPLRGELEELAQHRGDNRELLVRFLTAVLSEPPLLARIRQTAARRRANFVAHLREALARAQGPVAYIDVGFSGSNQENLQRLIDAEGLGIRLHGLYLMADPCPPDRLLRGHVIEGFLTSPCDPSPFEVLALDRNRLLIELLLLSDDGSTLEIDDRGQPVFAAQLEPARQRAQRRAVHDGIRAYQRHVNAYRLAGEDTAHVAALDRLVGRRIIERFVVEPTPEEARVFGAWEAEDDYNSLQTAPLVPGPEDTILRRLTREQLALQPMNRVFWPAAASTLWEDPLAASSTGPLAQAGAMRVQLLGADGSFSETLIPVRLGQDGVSVAEWRGASPGLCGISLSPVTVDGLLRLDSLVVGLVSAAGGWHSVLWSWSAGDDPAALPMSHGGWVAQDILNVGPESTLTVFFERKLAAEELVQIEFHGGFLPGFDTAARLERGPTGGAIVHRRPGLDF